jgi:TfoX/Sxy family transcriptional regulator of competence genes
MKNLDIFDKMVDTNSNFDRKGKTMIYTSANGYMFALLNKAGEVGIRLPKETAKRFMEKYESGKYMSYGAVMKDYVLIPENLFDDMDTLATYLEESYQFVMSLPAKPKKKK